MRYSFLISLVLGFTLVGCNDHPLKQVEFKNFPGNSDAGEDDSSSDSEDSGEDLGLATDTGGGETTDGGSDCGNGIVDADEQCDEGEANGPVPALCNEECFWNIA